MRSVHPAPRIAALARLDVVAFILAVHNGIVKK
jgi:hypothetical protein